MKYTGEDFDEKTKLAKKRTDLAVERNKMANERTFLSWIRTGLACVGGGIALIKFLTFTYEEHKLIARSTGQVLILTGVAIFLFAYRIFQQNYKELHLKTPYPMSVWMGAIFVIILSLLSIVLLFIA